MFTLPRLTGRLAVVALFGALLVTARDSAAQAGDAVLRFAILGGPAVTCTRSTTAGDVGVASTTAFTNTGCTITGNIHAGDDFAAQAYNDYLTAYNNIAATPCSGALLTGTLAGQNLAPGIYCVSAEAKTGVLTLNGPDTASWTFKVAGAFTGTSLSVVLAGGAQACNVIWWSEAAATQTDSDLKGNILSGAEITLTRGSFVGRALAKAAVTLTDVRTLSGCV
ncbi:MAG TPA: ice-binding family protein [Gemmatimonadales bacterium]|jgi:hypothetical protein|nr:ice-binding family protein [Gemmatimonadales bacterium]